MCSFECNLYFQAIWLYRLWCNQASRPKQDVFNLSIQFQSNKQYDFNLKKHSISLILAYGFYVIQFQNKYPVLINQFRFHVLGFWSSWKRMKTSNPIMRFLYQSNQAIKASNTISFNQFYQSGSSMNLAILANGFYMIIFNFKNIFNQIQFQNRIKQSILLSILGIS